MPNMLIRNVPAEVHARLTAGAKESGQSLQRYVLGLISTSSKQMSHAETIAWLRGRQERMARDGTDATESMNGPDIIREGRIERTQQMYDRLGWDFDGREDFE